MIARTLWILLLASMSFAWVSWTHCRAEAEGPVPLKQAVSGLNEELAAYQFDIERIRTRALSDDERPHPVTVDEVLTAIRKWDREKHPIDDSQYRFFQDILETKMLPPGAWLRFYVQWHRSKPNDNVEYRELRIDLMVMTGERKGYGCRVRTQNLDKRRYLALTPGYSWIAHPAPAEPNDWSSGGVVYTIQKDAERALHVIAATLVENGVDDLRGVAFDSAGNRYELTRRGIGGHNNMVMLRFELDARKVPSDNIEFFGIEGLTRDGMLSLSRLAVREAASQGLHVLPLPVVGTSFEFTLEATDGRVIDSSELLGKVVIVDCWASWCGPCIKQFPQLKQLHDRHHADGLEIIGLSVDENPGAAEKFYKAMGIEWPLVTIPDDEDARQLWKEAARILAVPRVLVVDKSGVLQSDGPELPLDRVVSLLDDARPLKDTK